MGLRTGNKRLETVHSTVESGSGSFDSPKERMMIGEVVADLELKKLEKKVETPGKLTQRDRTARGAKNKETKPKFPKKVTPKKVSRKTAKKVPKKSDLLTQEESEQGSNQTRKYVFGTIGRNIAAKQTTQALTIIEQKVAENISVIELEIINMPNSIDAQRLKAKYNDYLEGAKQNSESTAPDFREYIHESNAITELAVEKTIQSSIQQNPHTTSDAITEELMGTLGNDIDETMREKIKTYIKDFVEEIFEKNRQSGESIIQLDTDIPGAKEVFQEEIENPNSPLGQIETNIVEPRNSTDVVNIFEDISGDPKLKTQFKRNFLNTNIKELIDQAKGSKPEAIEKKYGEMTNRRRTRKAEQITLTIQQNKFNTSIAPLTELSQSTGITTGDQNTANMTISQLTQNNKNYIGTCNITTPAKKIYQSDVYMSKHGNQTTIPSLLDSSDFSARQIFYTKQEKNTQKSYSIADSTGKNEAYSIDKSPTIAAEIEKHLYQESILQDVCATIQGPQNKTPIEKIARENRPLLLLIDQITSQMNTPQLQDYLSLISSPAWIYSMQHSQITPLSQYKNTHPIASNIGWFFGSYLSGLSLQESQKILTGEATESPLESYEISSITEILDKTKNRNTLMTTASSSETRNDESEITQLLSGEYNLTTDGVHHAVNIA